jgi:hypothetical protein
MRAGLCAERGGAVTTHAAIIGALLGVGLLLLIIGCVETCLLIQRCRWERRNGTYSYRVTYYDTDPRRETAE